jgi:hypothetical protein
VRGHHRRHGGEDACRDRTSAEDDPERQGELDPRNPEILVCRYQTGGETMTSSDTIT